MRVAFDENVPPTIAKVFIALSKEKVIHRTCKDLIVEKAQDYAPKVSDADYVRKSDVPWVDRFAKAGGKAIISGDVNMRNRAHERLALYDHGFIVIFFDPSWTGLTFFRKSSLLLHWWEEITAKLSVAAPGTFWAIPSNWPLKGGELRNVSFGLAKLLKDSPLRSSAPAKPPKRRKPAQSRHAVGQTEFSDLLESKKDADEG